MSVSKLDLFERIKEHYKSLIDKGAFLEDEALPSVRQAALSLGVNPNTVQKAYQELSDEGYIDIIPKKGAYVKKHIHQPEKKLLEDIFTMIHKLKLYYNDDEIFTIIKNHLEGENHDWN